MYEKVREVNITESVEVSIEALSILGLDIAKDPLLFEVLKNDYEQLINKQPRPGEPFVHLPLENDYQLRKMLDIMDEKIYSGKKFPGFSVWHKTNWTHGAEDISHILMGVGKNKKYPANLNSLFGQSRLALSDGENDMIPFVHFADKLFDREVVKKNDNDEQTQIEAFKLYREQYELENPDFDVFTIDVASYAMLTLYRRIKGEKMQTPFGVMIIPELGRKAIMGGSVVSIVHEGAGGQIELGWSRGNRSLGTGLGIAVGSNK